MNVLLCVTGNRGKGDEKFQRFKIGNGDKLVDHMLKGHESCANCARNHNGQIVYGQTIDISFMGKMKWKIF